MTEYVILFRLAWSDGETVEMHVDNERLFNMLMAWLRTQEAENIIYDLSALDLSPLMPGLAE